MGQGVCRSCSATCVEELWSDEVYQQQAVAAIAVAATATATATTTAMAAVTATAATTSTGTEVVSVLTVSTISGQSMECLCTGSSDIQLTIANLKHEIADSEWRVPCACQMLASMDANADEILQDSDHLTDSHYVLVISFEMLDSGSIQGQQAEAVLQDLARLGPSCVESFHVATREALRRCIDIDWMLTHRQPSCLLAISAFVQFAEKGDQSAATALCCLGHKIERLRELEWEWLPEVQSAVLLAIPLVADYQDIDVVVQIESMFMTGACEMLFVLLSGGQAIRRGFYIEFAAVQALTLFAEKGNSRALEALEGCYRCLLTFPDGWTDGCTDCKTVKRALADALDMLGGSLADVEQYRFLTSRWDKLNQIRAHRQVPYLACKRILANLWYSLGIGEQASVLEAAISEMKECPLR